LIDDDEDDFLITSEYIRQIPGMKFEIDWCPHYEDALAELRNKNYDLYFTDYRLGIKSGVDLLRDALEFNNEEPVILLTGKGNRNIDMEAMQLGAYDYLVKTELTTEKIERAIRYALDRAAALRALKANERKYRGIFEKTKDLVFITDEMLDFKNVNDAALMLLGYTSEEMVQMNLCDLVDQAQHKKFMLQSLQNGIEINDLEVLLTAKNGEKRICILTATIEKGTEEAIYIQGIIHDITNLKREEKAVLQAEKLAAAGRLVRTLAHEVRNPLNNITLSVEQLQQEISRSDSAEMYLDIIMRNSRRISDLISELLNSSRPTESALENVCLQTVVDDVIAVALDRITLKHISMSISYPEEALIILADREKLKLALLNIVINAVEAMEEHKGILNVSIQAVDQQAIIQISDNGCGISEESIARLFEPYFTQKRNGVGLGLAFTLNIIQAHKGTIEVQSVEGAGTKFFIILPLFNVKSDALPASGNLSALSS